MWKKLFRRSPVQPMHLPPGLPRALIATAVNAGYVQSGLFANWARSLTVVGQKHRILVAAMDAESLVAAEELGLATVRLHVVTPEPPSSGALRYKHDGWKAVVFQKLVLVRALLQDGHSVLFSDADIIFRQDPLPWFPHEARSDAAFQSDARAGAKQLEPSELNSGLYFIHPTAPAIEFLTYDKADWAADGDDQDCLRRRVWRVPGLRLKMLSLEDFPNGRVWRTSPPPDPVAVHLNWVIGVEEKVRFAKDTGLWLLD